MPQRMGNWRRAIIIVAMAIFVGLPIGTLFLQSPTSSTVIVWNGVILIVAMIIGGIVGNWIFNKLNEHISSTDPQVVARREAGNRRGVMLSYILFPLAFLGDAFFYWGKQPSVFDLAWPGLGAIIAFIVWKRRDPDQIALKTIWRNGVYLGAASFVLLAVYFFVFRPAQLNTTPNVSSATLETYISPSGFGIQYPGSWYPENLSYPVLGILSVPVSNGYNDSCGIVVGTDENPTYEPLQAFVAGTNGNSDVVSSNPIQVDSLTGIREKIMGTLGTGVDVTIEEAFLTFSSSTIIDAQLECGNSALQYGESVFDTMLETIAKN
jgi:hypothetical protein